MVYHTCEQIKIGQHSQNARETYGVSISGVEVTPRTAQSVDSATVTATLTGSNGSRLNTTATTGAQIPTIYINPGARCSGTVINVNNYVYNTSPSDRYESAVQTTGNPYRSACGATFQPQLHRQALAQPQPRKNLARAGMEKEKQRQSFNIGNTSRRVVTHQNNSAKKEGEKRNVLENGDQENEPAKKRVMVCSNAKTCESNSNSNSNCDGNINSQYRNKELVESKEGKHEHNNNISDNNITTLEQERQASEKILAKVDEQVNMYKIIMRKGYDETSNDNSEIAMAID